MKGFSLYAVAFAALCLIVRPASAQPGYHLVREIRIGGENGWDYLTFDPSGRRLFVSHGDRVVVVDAVGDSIVGEIPRTEGVHGVALDPENGLGYVSCGRSGTVVVFDQKTLRKTAEIPVGKNPDAILFDPYSHDVFVFNGGSSDATVIDPAENKVKKTVPLGGKPEFGVTDSKGHVYVNIEDRSEVVSINARTFKADSRWSIAPGEDPTGLAIDTDNLLLFSVCRNERMVVSDIAKREVVATLPIGSGVDGCVYDPQLHYAIASNGTGTLTVVDEVSPQKFEVIETDATRRGARTIALDPETHTLYLPTAEFEPAPPATGGSRPQRPVIKPNSFVVLQYQR